MADVKALAEQLVNLTVKEVNELAAVLKEQYGIEPAAAAAPVVVASAAAADAPKAEEQTSFTVVLKNAGAQKLQVVKLLKDTLGLSLGDAKALADNVPATVKENVDKAQAEALKKSLTEAGAEVELK